MREKGKRRNVEALREEKMPQPKRPKAGFGRLKGRGSIGHLAVWIGGEKGGRFPKGGNTTGGGKRRVRWLWRGRRSRGGKG